MRITHKKKILFHWKQLLQSILLKSLKKASAEQGLEKMVKRLSAIVPDISKQYSVFNIDTVYLNRKVRNQHGFQISLLDKVIDCFEKPVVVVDIGDSAGTHLQYLKAIYSKKKIRCLSVNLDEQAVEKIKQKGLDAVKARAENIGEYNIHTDVFLCFEMLEHLMNPAQFLYDLSSQTKAQYLVVTVPYHSKSQIGLHHIRKNRQTDVYAENTHILELCPEDWRLLVRHSGWDIYKDRIYLQYPQRGLLRLAKLIWRKYDFEGFYGMILKKNTTWSSRYKNW